MNTAIPIRADAPNPAKDEIMNALNAKFPNRQLLNIQDVADYTGLSRATVKRQFNLSRGKYIHKITLAHKLAE